MEKEFNTRFLTVKQTLVSPKAAKNKNIIGVILAAGEGKRMKSALPKVAHTILGKPMLHWVMDAMMHAGVEHMVVVVSPERQSVEELAVSFANENGIRVTIAPQPKARGTGHAVQCAMDGVAELAKTIESKDIHMVVAFGDLPAISAETYQALFQFHLDEKNDFSILCFRARDPYGYGRILLKDGKFQGIREEKDCDSEEKKINLCNAGLICGTLDQFKELLPLVKDENAANEYYLTDVPLISKEKGGRVGIFDDVSEEEVAGVNSPEQLADMTKFLQKKFESLNK